MSIMMLGFWALVAWVIVMVVRGASGPRSHAPSAEEILAERFARGEIDEQDYRKRRDALRSTP
jgi:putative membrane protein